MIRSDAEIEIASPVARVCTILCDTSRAPAWMESCVKLEVTSPDGWRPGATLHYIYSQGGHQGDMDGVVSEYQPNTRLTMEFTDAKFGVTAGFEFFPTPNGTRVTHYTQVNPKGLLGRVMQPLIKAGNQKQVAANLARLKNLVESAVA